MTSVLPVSNIINVTVTQTPSGLTERNVNSVMLLTNEAPNNVDSFRTYVSAAQVAEDYGTASTTAKMANAIFAQSLNIRTGNGVLNIAPMDGAVGATSGEFVTDISSNLTNFQAISDGEFQLTLDGNTTDVTGLNFTNASTISDVVKIIQKKLRNVNIEENNGVLTFTSKKVGTVSEVNIGTLTGGTGTDISAAGTLDAGNATTSTGQDSSGETVEAAIDRLGQEVSFVGVMTNINLEDAAVAAVADSVQATDRIFLHHFSSLNDLDGFGASNKAQGNTQTRPVLHTRSIEEANLVKAAYMGRAFSVNTRGAATAQTLQIKELRTVSPDPLLNNTDYFNALDNGVDVYGNFEGVIGVSSSGGNDFFDNVYSDIALKFALTTAGFNHLRQTNTKIPQTEAGVNGLKNAYAQVLNRFVTNGFLAPGSWTSSERFGNPEVFDENIRQRGYYIFSQPITQQDPVEREQRKAPLIQIAAKRSGAIHQSSVLVVVND